MLPPHLVAEFWATVENELSKRHDLSQVNAAKAISSYRAALDRHRVDEMVYHRDPEAIAETIAAGWECGFPDPRVSSKA